MESSIEKKLNIKLDSTEGLILLRTVLEALKFNSTCVEEYERIFLENLKRTLENFNT